jgi:hypothetical protein
LCFPAAALKQSAGAKPSAFKQREPTPPINTGSRRKTRRMATKKAETPGLAYDDRPDLLETFADNVQRMTFDGRTLRIEFCVARRDDPVADKPRSGKSIPVVRLVLDLDGAVDLFNKINSLQAALENAGVIRKNAPAAAA